MSIAEVLEQAMKLPTQEREALAHELLASLPPPNGDDGHLSDKWVCEIQARIARLERGETQARPWREVMDEIDKELDEESA